MCPITPASRPRVWFVPASGRGGRCRWAPARAATVVSPGYARVAAPAQAGAVLAGAFGDAPSRGRLPTMVAVSG
eukprot:9965503-Lingulodinium_polyedra.AAC.1